MEKEVRDFIRRMSSANPLWGSPRMQGELAKIGISVAGFRVETWELAAGADTYKLKFGHRGGNQPVRQGAGHNVEITSQNHGFAVAADTLRDDALITHINLNDNTVEGLQHKTAPAFSVQYHPEAAPGPHDPYYLFEEFIDLMEKQKKVEQ